MVLQSVNAQHYLRCQRVYINTDNKDPVRSRSNFDMVLDLPELYENVQSVELVSWMVPFDISPTIFVDNELLDVTFAEENGDERISATLTIPRGGYTAQTLLDMLVLLMTNWLENLGNDHYYTRTPRPGQILSRTDTVFTTGIQDGKIWMTALRDLRDVSDAPDFTLVDQELPIDFQFLFGSGPNAGSPLATTLGMTPDTDTYLGEVAGIRISGPRGVAFPVLSMHRSVDVFVDDVDYQVARVPLTRADFVSKRFVHTKFRLLDTPIRHTQEIRARLRFSDGSEPATLSTNGYDLVFDYLLLSPETCIPRWVRQQLQM
jgi:hypothetical protein